MSLSRCDLKSRLVYTSTDPTQRAVCVWELWQHTSSKALPAPFARACEVQMYNVRRRQYSVDINTKSSLQAVQLRRFFGSRYNTKEARRTRKRHKSKYLQDYSRERVFILVDRHDKCCVLGRLYLAFC